MLPQEETDEILKATPLLKGDLTVVEVYNEKEEDRVPENNPKWTMSKDEMKAVFDNLTMGVGRQAELEWDQESVVTTKDRLNRDGSLSSLIKYTHACHRLGTSSEGKP